MMHARRSATKNFFAALSSSLTSRRGRDVAASQQPQAWQSPSRPSSILAVRRFTAGVVDVKRIREDPGATSSSSAPLDDAATFHSVADHTLEQIMQLLVPVESEQDDVDISSSQGVLNINLGARGMWVINKQTPNRQLWWSSPYSGPRRYEYQPDAASGGSGSGGSASGAGADVSKWRGTADKQDMLTLLHAEIERATGIDILNP